MVGGAELLELPQALKLRGVDHIKAEPGQPHVPVDLRGGRGGKREEGRGRGALGH